MARHPVAGEAEDIPLNRNSERAMGPDADGIVAVYETVFYMIALSTPDPADPGKKNLRGETVSDLSPICIIYQGFH